MYLARFEFYVSHFLNLNIRKIELKCFLADYKIHKNTKEKYKEFSQMYAITAFIKLLFNHNKKRNDDDDSYKRNYPAAKHSAACDVNKCRLNQNRYLISRIKLHASGC